MQFTYDDDGRLQTETQEAGGQSRASIYEYGSDGRLATIVNPLGETRSYVYDGVGRTKSVTSGDTGQTRFTFDANDNLVSVAPPDRPAHALEYDGGTRLSGYVPPDLGETASNGFVPGQLRYGFDEFGRPTGVTLANGASVQNHYFQGFYRPSQVSISPGANGRSEDHFFVTYRSDDNDLVESIFGPRNGVLYDYDPPLLERIEFQTQAASGIINLDYDDFLRVSELHLVGSSPVEYLYDSDSLLIQAGPLTVARNPEDGRIAGTVIGSVTTAKSWSPFGEPETYSAAFDSETLFSQSYERDELGRIIELIETNQGVTTTKNYNYDAAGRLQSVTDEGTTTRFFYDKNGNRFTSEALSGAGYDDQDRVEFFAQWTCAATDAGDVTRRINADETDGYELVYTPLGALERATLVADGTSIAYETDPVGRRVGRRVNGGSPKGWLYSNRLRIIAEIDNAARTDFIYGTRP